ncbi:hypothetical protein [Halorussus halobius]|uniref:hypothetical protein n=1 Tax=Halorussus halobius TaxID=1710537 RepID=UPI001092B2DE|nr:hypothetical protein [Halorussus halobius]
MRAESDRDASESTAGTASAAEEGSDSRVHVRRLDVADTLRWSWVTLRDRPELVALGVAANLPSIAAALGITRPSPSADLDVAVWTWPAYLVQLLAVAVVAGVVYLSAADAVAGRSRRLADRLGSAVRRLPALAATGVAFVVAVGAGLSPAYLVEGSSLAALAVGALAALFAVYAFYRLLLSFPACVVDAAGPVASVRSGWAAATGIVRKVFAVGVVYAVAGVASTAASGLFGGEYDVASTLVSSITGGFVFPFFGLALAHLYLEGSRNR